MGTTIFFLTNNDLGKPLNKMGRRELEKLDNLSLYVETSYCAVSSTGPSSVFL